MSVAMAASPCSPLAEVPPTPTFTHTHALPFSSYLVTNLMGADLNNIVKFQRLSDEHVQFLIYQLLRGLKVINSIMTHLLYPILNATWYTVYVSMQIVYQWFPVKLHSFQAFLFDVSPQPSHMNFKLITY